MSTVICYEKGSLLGIDRREFMRRTTNLVLVEDGEEERIKKL